jgi:hypothetical protein
MPYTYMLENTDRQIIKDNPEKLEKYSTQDTGKINVGEYRRCVILCPTLIIKSRDASVILIPTLIDKSHDPSNELIRIIFYTKVCNINSFVSFRFVSFRFRKFRFVSFRFYFVSHFIGAHIYLPVNCIPDGSGDLLISVGINLKLYPVERI